MQINVTFVIQIINFWISYTVLHKLLFKPFVGLIHNKEAARDTLTNGLKAKEQRLLQLQEDKKKNLETFRSYIKAQYPFKTVPLEKIPPEFAFTKNQDELDVLIASEKNLLLQKASPCILK